MADKPTAKRARDEGGDEQGDSRPAKRTVTIDDFDSTVTVLVGPEDNRFMLHQDVVCAKSKFFKAACSKQWREGQERTVRLSEADSITFKAYCDWSYSDEVSEILTAEEEDPKEKTAEDWRLMEIYIMGDTLDDVALRNRVVLMFFKRMQRHKFLPHAAIDQRVWGSLPKGSPMKKMIVDVIVSRLSIEIFALRVSTYPQELVQEIALAAKERAPNESWETIARRTQQYQEGVKAD